MDIILFECELNKLLNRECKATFRDIRHDINPGELYEAGECLFLDSKKIIRSYATILVTEVKHIEPDWLFDEDFECEEDPSKTLNHVAIDMGYTNYTAGDLKRLINQRLDNPDTIQLVDFDIEELYNEPEIVLT